MTRANNGVGATEADGADWGAPPSSAASSSSSPPPPNGSVHGVNCELPADRHQTLGREERSAPAQRQNESQSQSPNPCVSLSHGVWGGGGSASSSGSASSRRVGGASASASASTLPPAPAPASGYSSFVDDDVAVFECQVCSLTESTHIYRSILVVSLFFLTATTGSRRPHGIWGGFFFFLRRMRFCALDVPKAWIFGSCEVYSTLNGNGPRVSFPAGYDALMS